MAHPALLTVPWNLRKAVKEMLLLEEHLTDPEQRCPDCIWKHLLKAEAWLEEAANLDGRREYTALLRQAMATLTQVQAMVKAGQLPNAAISARQLRKGLQPYVVGL
jgi:hypothetical protein